MIAFHHLLRMNSLEALNVPWYSVGSQSIIGKFEESQLSQKYRCKHRGSFISKSPVVIKGTHMVLELSDSNL